MSYKCRVCDLKITHDELWDFECGECTMDDWDEIGKSESLFMINERQKNEFNAGLEKFAELVKRMEQLRKEEAEDYRELFRGCESRIRK
ncbi:hypothetical protein [Bacillus solitudinis]|uniref:hypothetical protein n=1 Tax=Bacillus solitudinis TaxID=2014074 RepID=UPI000C24DF0E|nr:hypothetical protein [Bacillus solitudinis]